MWSGRRQKIAMRLALTPFRPKQGILSDHSVAIRMPSGCGDVRGISPQGLVCPPVSPALLVSCLRNNECTNFCMAFDFFFFLERGEVYVGEGKPLMKWIHSKSQGKTSGWFFIILKNVAKTTPLVILHPDEERQLLNGTFALGVTKDITSHWWERRKNASSSPRSCELLSTIKWSLYFSDTSLPWCHADKRLLHAPFSKKSHLPNNSGTVLVIRFWILETIFLMVTSIFNVNRLMLCSNGSSLSPFVHQKIQMGFFFYFLTRKGKPYH